jgi:hypothetical protein
MAIGKVNMPSLLRKVFGEEGADFVAMGGCPSLSLICPRGLRRGRARGYADVSTTFQ